MAHLGVVDEVPDLGASVRYTTLQQFEGLVDYLALGHIHKPYEGPADEPWFFNPGSLEAHDTQEARWNLGYYVTDIEQDSIEPHHHTLASDDRSTRTTGMWTAMSPGPISPRRSTKRSPMNNLTWWTSAQPRSTRRATEPRVPQLLTSASKVIWNSIDATSTWMPCESKIFDTTNPIHVQTKVSVTTAEILDLVEGLDEDAVFTDTGTLRTEVLEGEVFTTVAEQTPYAEDPEATAEVLQLARRNWSSKKARVASRSLTTSNGAVRKYSRMGSVPSTRSSTT